MSNRARLTSSLKHRDFRLLIIAFSTSEIGSWAYNVALVVWIFEQTGSAAWVGASTIARFVPALLFSAYGGVLADKFERVRLMVTIDLISFAIMMTLAFEVAADVPVAIAIATATLTSTLNTAYEPAVVAMTPQLAGERDLGSANALRNTVDNVCVIAGPGLGAVLLLIGPPYVAIAVNALTFLVSGITVSRIRARSTPVDVSDSGELGAFRQMFVGIKAIASSSVASALVAYSVIATFVFGLDTVLFVVLSEDVLDTGSEGYGYLLAGLGLGGVLAAGLVTRLEQRSRIGLVILLGMAVYCLPTLVFLFASSPVVAFVVEMIRGAGTLVVDVLAITALQRALPREMLARVFGALNALMLLAILVGALVAPLLVDISLSTALWFSGLVIPIACLAGWPILNQIDRQAVTRQAELKPRLTLLEGCDLFADVSAGGIDQLAEAAVDVSVESGQVVIREGAPADYFYVVVDGQFTVTSRGQGNEVSVLGRLTAGDYFGEIGLLEHMPRTATVSAASAGHLLKIDEEAFLDALTEFAPSPALMDGASLRLQRTHPAISLTGSGLQRSEPAE
jgi:MFS family permease